MSHERVESRFVIDVIFIFHFSSRFFTTHAKLFGSPDSSKMKPGKFQRLILNRTAIEGNIY